MSVTTTHAYRCTTMNTLYEYSVRILERFMHGYHGLDISGYSGVSGFRYLSESNKQ